MNKYRKEVSEITDESPWTIFKIGLKIVLPTLILLFVGSWIVGIGTIVSQPMKAVQKTMDADNMIYNYEWFKQMNENISAASIQINNAQSRADQFKEDAGGRSEWDRTDKEEYSRLTTTLLGLQNHRESMVADYNARSKMANKNLFKGKDLPETVQ